MKVKSTHTAILVRGFVTVVTTYPLGRLKLNQFKPPTASSLVDEKTVSKAHLTGRAAKDLASHPTVQDELIETKRLDTQLRGLSTCFAPK
jgi:hypothetical protein